MHDLMNATCLDDGGLGEDGDGDGDGIPEMRYGYVCVHDMMALTRLESTSIEGLCL